MNPQPVSYLQTDPRWAGIDYSAKGEKTTIKGSGCGPTAMAMVIATWADKNVTPVETCAWSLSHGYKAVNQGTYYSYFKPQGAVYGIQAEQINGANLRNVSASVAAPYHAKVLAALQQGDMVICCMGQGLWTTSGHFILLWDVQGDTAYVNDPASTRTARTRGSWARLKREVKYYFICRKPEQKKEEDEDMTQEKFNELLNAGLTEEKFNEKFTAAMKTYLDELARKKDESWGPEWDEAKAWAEGQGVILGDETGNKQYQAWTTRQALVLMLYRMNGKG